MPVIYPIEFPSNIGIANFSFGLRVAVARTESPFSFVEQVVKYSGEILEIEVALPPLFRDDAEEFNAFLFKLRGRFGTFLIGDPNGVNPRGSWGGTPVIDGAGQTGDELHITGLPPSVVNVGRTGDYIQLGTGANARLYKLLENASSNAAGEATLLLAPNLRTSPENGSEVIYQNAKGVFRLGENLQGFKINDNSIYSLQFKATESLGIGPIVDFNYLVDPSGNVAVDPDGNYQVEPE